jgi:hypothetical protein
LIKVPNTYIGEKTVFLTGGARKTGYSLKLDAYHSPYSKINSRPDT